MSITRGIILAAGMGRRLGALTRRRPKALLSVNGMPIIRRLTEQLTQAGVTEITVVLGYEGDQIVDELSHEKDLRVTFINTSEFQTYNNITSIAKCLPIHRPVVICDCDIFLSHLPKSWLSQPEDGADVVVPTRPAVLGEKGTVLWSTGEPGWRMEVLRSPSLSEYSLRKSLSMYFVHSDSIAKEFSESISTAIREGRKSIYYEDVLSSLHSRFRFSSLDALAQGVRSWEIDTVHDLKDVKRYLSTPTHSTTVAVDRGPQ